jgi:hypothetical protein
MAEPRTDGVGALLRPLFGLLANVVVITSLLVFIGWKRAETQSSRLGLSEAIFTMSTQDYVLRSVETVLVLLLGVSVLAAMWVALDRWLSPRATALRNDDPRDDATTTRWVLRLLAVAWLVLPGLVVLLGLVDRFQAVAFVLLPAAIGVGVLLLLYAAHLGGLDMGTDDHAGRRVQVLQASGVVVALVCVFWTGSNYAEVDGHQLAADIDRAPQRILPGVVLSTDAPLHLEGPGVLTEEIADETATGEDAARYRYSGLRLLEYARGTYFLVSDGWSTALGVVFVVPEDHPGLSVQFLRVEGAAP